MEIFLFATSEVIQGCCHSGSLTHQLSQNPSDLADSFTAEKRPALVAPHRLAAGVTPVRAASLSGPLVFTRDKPQLRLRRLAAEPSGFTRASPLIFAGAQVNITSFYSDRVAGGHRHHRHSGSPPSPSLGSCEGQGTQTSCLSNLRQVALAYTMYRGDHQDVNVPYRYCPDTPNDIYGENAGVPSGNGPNNPPPTGPNEMWWSAYDPTQVPDGPTGAGFKFGLMYGYFGTTNIFKCAVEPQWQCSFAMNYSTGSPMTKRDSFVSHASDRLVAWDHRRSPGCSDSRVAVTPRPPWLPFDNTSHYPTRHSGRMNGMFYDGHVSLLKPTELRVSNFREPGTLPAVPGYPGE